MIEPFNVVAQLPPTEMLSARMQAKPRNPPTHDRYVDAWP